MVLLIFVNLSSAKRITVSMPVSWRLTSAISFSYSKSLHVLTPRRSMVAPTCCAKSVVSPSYSMTLTLGSSAKAFSIMAFRSCRVKADFLSIFIPMPMMTWSTKVSARLTTD